MYPVLPGKIDVELEELKNQLLSQANRLGRELNPWICAELSEFILKINSYYTNSMEGNPSKLKDIENALSHQFSSDSVTRNYQMEHVAHINVQKKMYARLKSEPDLDICSSDFICWLHQEFYQQLPSDLCIAQTLSGKRVAIIPGKLRNQGARVGGHDAPATWQEIQQYLGEFQSALSPARLAPKDRILALASSHHRLLWIHPFADGNGRVARLFTSAYADRVDIDPNHLWNVSRAFARNRGEYDRYLALSDLPRRNDYDGRGPLSDEGLTQFCKFFLRSCVDQVQYMEQILKLSHFKIRLARYLRDCKEEKTISEQAAKILEYIFLLGEVGRGQVRELCGVKERRANQIVQEVLGSGIAQTPSAYGPLRLKLTVDLAAALFPDL